MPVFVALLLAATFLTTPSYACEPGGGSTFCADGWISAPVSRDRPREDPAEAGWSDDSVPGEVYVEGAVPVDGNPPLDEEGL